MSKASTSLASVAATVGRLTFFVFLILGVPIILLLPAGGVQLPSPPPLVNRILASLYYGSIAGLVGICGLGITWNLLKMAYGRWTGAHTDDTHGTLSPLKVLWWCWLVILSWAAFITFGKAMVDVWTAVGVS